MFLEDAFVTERLRARRISMSLLVAATAFAACLLVMFGLVSTARAEGAPQKTGQFADEAAQPKNTSTVNLPQTATRADAQIQRGLTLLLMALTAASGLAVWRRRIRSLVFAGGKRHAA